MDPSDLSRLETFLEPSRIVIVATIGRDGTPHLTPNWYVFENGRLCISTTKERVKYRKPLTGRPRLPVRLLRAPGRRVCDNMGTRRASRRRVDVAGDPADS